MEYEEEKKETVFLFVLTKSYQWLVKMTSALGRFEVRIIMWGGEINQPTKNLGTIRTEFLADNTACVVGRSAAVDC